MNLFARLITAPRLWRDPALAFTFRRAWRTAARFA
jgi:hypothetical protein